MARRYFTAKQLDEVKDDRAQDIQCFLRQCFAWRRVRRLREARYEEEFQEIKEREEKELREQEEHKKQIVFHLHSLLCGEGSPRC